MTPKSNPTKEELVEYGRNLNKLDSHNTLCSKLEPFAEDSENDGFQLVYISLEDLYAENWDAIQLEREFEWEDYKSVEELSVDHGYGRTLYPEEAKFLIDMFETESKKEFYVGLICEGVVVDSIEAEAVEEEEDEDETETTSELPTPPEVSQGIDPINATFKLVGRLVIDDKQSGQRIYSGYSSEYLDEFKIPMQKSWFDSVYRVKDSAYMYIKYEHFSDLFSEDISKITDKAMEYCSNPHWDASDVLPEHIDPLFLGLKGLDALCNYLSVSREDVLKSVFENDGIEIDSVQIDAEFIETVVEFKSGEIGKDEFAEALMYYECNSPMFELELHSVATIWLDNDHIRRELEDAFGDNVPGLKEWEGPVYDKFEQLCNEFVEDLKERYISGYKRKDVPQPEVTEPEKTPLELLAQRTANEHEAAFGKLMEAMIDTDPSAVQVALKELNACRERSKEICGLTDEWRVKVEAEMKRQWEEKYGVA